jgi:UDP-N-acetylglucosamine--N-acetylmuramyl-(pentapeptide) pyrophosphoryl-undecaprenol N-acetylglucosamine transferase
MNNSHLMIMAGGTGGHVFPALAVANHLRDSGVNITWLGTRKGLEASVIPANDIAIEWVTVEGLRGKSKLSLLLAPFKLLRAMWQSAAAIRKVQPDCVLGMGGFVSGPGGLVTRIMGKPLVVHEQNAVAGLTNKYLAKFANVVMTGFPEVRDLPASAQWVGNPVRKNILPVHSNESKKVNVLIIGGSQGAHTFNAKLPGVFKQVSDSQVSIWHQSGRGRADQVESSYADNGVRAKVTEFIDDMAAAYAWADLLVCRAGAMTIAECCAAAKPALLVPYPFSAGDHQDFNAQTLVNVGAAEVFANKEISSSDFQAALARLVSDKATLKSMGQRAYSLHKPSALDDVADVCREFLNA